MPRAAGSMVFDTKVVGYTAINGDAAIVNGRCGNGSPPVQYRSRLIRLLYPNDGLPTYQAYDSAYVQILRRYRTLQGQRLLRKAALDESGCLGNLVLPARQLV